MSIEIIEENIFKTQHQTLVNTVNCVGVMGAGLAFECKLRYPKMFEKYKEFCERRLLRPGVLSLYKGGEDSEDIDNRWILNFPTKDDWRYPSQMAYLDAGLDKFLETYQQKGIQSVAFPVLGSQNGGLNPDEVVELMLSKLKACTIPITIYRYSPTASDDVYNEFKCELKKIPYENLKAVTRIRTKQLDLVLEALESSHIHQMNQLIRVKGIGEKTLQKLFSFVRHRNDDMMLFSMD